ncbi:hypothetical protein [Amycolatopsis cihanbeyliensis]|nr:hypothetical protein [Amycolatopsis cihanbeyliensis]
MPSTPRRKLRDARRLFTGEEKPTAEAGAGRRDLGLDRCTPSQQRLRALLALHLFNAHLRGPNVGPSHVYSAHTFLAYSMTVSPRYDRLLFIIPPAVENALGRLMAPRTLIRHGMPGLRMVAAHDYHTYHIVHLPTGARMTLANRVNFLTETEIQRQGFRRGRRTLQDYAGPDTPLDPAEQAALDAIPPMTTGVRVLLAALVSRLNARDPQKRWAVGQWWQDPLRRPEPAGYRHDELMYLWGSGADWELRWLKHPRPTDVVACLTEPRIGVPGATATKGRRGWTIRLGQSTLSLRYGAVR